MRRRNFARQNAISKHVHSVAGARPRVITQPRPEADIILTHLASTRYVNLRPVFFPTVACVNDLSLWLARPACVFQSPREPDCDAIGTRRIIPDKASETFGLNHVSWTANAKTRSHFCGVQSVNHGPVL